MAERQLYTIETSFNARHSTGKEPHAHTFIVKMILQKKGEDVRPFSNYEKAIDEHLSKYRGHYLNDLEVFENTLPTLENLCYVLYNEMREFFAREDYYEVLRVEVGDNPTRQIALGSEVYISAINRFYGELE